MLRKVVLALSLMLFWVGLLASPTSAQNDERPEPKRYEDVTWNTVYLYEFKPGKEGRATEILGKHLLPAYKKASVPAPRVVELRTGPWDVMIVSEMEEGPSEMTWKVSPEQPKIQKAMREMLGKENAGKITSEYGNSIARSTSFVGISGRHSSPITDKVPE